MSPEENTRLSGLREKLGKNEEEHRKLKEQIAKEEQRLKQKEKRENEKWWKSLLKEMESLFQKHYGDDYKGVISKEMLCSILSASLPEPGAGIDDIRTCRVDPGDADTVDHVSGSLLVGTQENGAQKDTCSTAVPY